MDQSGRQPPSAGQQQAQESADRIRLLRQELDAGELKQVLQLTPDQANRFDEWSRTRLSELATQFDVDTSASQKRVTWGMRIASTLGGIAICTAIVLFFMRYWGYLDTSAQVGILVILPLLGLAGAEYASTRERTLYFTGLLALVSFSSFVMNLMVLGGIFNLVSTERALLAWSAFALLLAYRYGLRPMLALGLLALTGYVVAAVTAQMGNRWFDFDQRPELVANLAVLIFFAPAVIDHRRHSNFPTVYRVVAAIVFFICILSLAEWGIPSYLPFRQENIERVYEFTGLLVAAGAIWLGIREHWNGLVNTSATAFVVFLYARLYHWWWEWMPKYLFFAIIGAIGIALVVGFKHVRGQLAGEEELA